MKSLITLTLLICWASCTQAKLQFVQVIFRHGDRAPDSNGLETYPNDPYKNCSFDPILRGGLTNEGKMREYALGTLLRNMYGELLGDTYYPKDVKAHSTDYDRTKMSLQLVLAGLYPPNEKQRWNSALDWQPIPIAYYPRIDDNLMLPEECPLFLASQKRAMQSPEYLAKLKKFELFMRYLTNVTGMEIYDPDQMYSLYHTLRAQQSMNLTLPEWVTEDIFPKGKLLDGINFAYEIFGFNREMIRLNGGMLIKRIIDDMTLFNRTKENQSKMNLYSGHESNIVAPLQALRLYDYDHAPEYSSALFFELHKEDDAQYVKLKYYKGIPAEQVELVIPGCGAKCTLDQLKKATIDVYPSDFEMICDKRSVRRQSGK